jgi:hypothetical protein
MANRFVQLPVADLHRLGKPQRCSSPEQQNASAFAYFEHGAVFGRI